MADEVTTAEPSGAVPPIHPAVVVVERAALAATLAGWLLVLAYIVRAASGDFPDTTTRLRALAQGGSPIAALLSLAGVTVLAALVTQRRPVGPARYGLGAAAVLAGVVGVLAVNGLLLGVTEGTGDARVSSLLGWSASLVLAGVALALAATSPARPAAARRRR